MVDFEKEAIIENLSKVINTKLTEKANKFVTADVREFGFIGDGLVSDTAAVQKALDYCESLGGGEVIFPKKQKVKLSKAGYRSIWTWNTKTKLNRAYALLIPSNVTVNFNECELIANNEGADVINLIENKNASVDLTKDSNIEIKNVTINQSIDIDTFAYNSMDSCAVCFQNIDGLVLDNVKVLNTYGYGMRIIKASNIEFRNKIQIDKCLGCNIRLGWQTFIVDKVNINLLVCSDSSNRLTANAVQGNTLHMNACSDFVIKEFRQTTSNPNKYVGSVNINNNCSNVYLGKVYSIDTGFKIQDYSSDGSNQPYNIVIEDMYTEGILDRPLFYIMGEGTKINNLRCKNIGHFWINNGKYTQFGRAILEKSSFVVKGNLPKEVHFDKLYLYNSSAAFQSNGGQDVVTIKDLTIKWDETTNTGSYLKLLDIQCKFMNIGSIVHKLEGSMKDGGNQKGGILSCSTENTLTKIGNIIDQNGVKTENVVVTLSTGMSTMINLAASNIWRDSWLNVLDVELVPVDLTSSIVIYNSFIADTNGQSLKINHSKAKGMEQFRLIVKGYKHIKE
ncbi:hypothetical protein [Priestia megaterium]|uniref:hypothetical protein n=1 Tax=Priestia megaterium TaxID=1404 RepID=UPI00112A86A5|nr:hypothetical protein [Priestia megaterium]TPF17657.1 hypothetical protein CBE78_00100 [Priestia megaterium]TPF21763.1 hypothetical protein CBE79_02600 [Priestia megaterium]